ncbi:Flagellar biosynthesis protein FliS [hydrothermal vent metagenome]|uniref:Flagellar biosynthesis protein FliS n=1 Tax=hydrothermal vent metagenome TaxID=652676 RepID=A0A3B0WKQ6_9ZZZZ
MSFTTTKNSINHYSSVDNYTAVTDADPHQLVRMLLDGALKKISIVKGLMIRKDVAKKGEVIGQALSIIAGLRSSLDLTSGGELALNLDNLYEYIERRLLEANLKNDIAILDETSKLLHEIKTGWEAIPTESKTRSGPNLSVAS